MFYSPLKNATYRAVWIVTFFSNIGTWIHTVTCGLLMTKLTASPALIALVQTASMAPIFIFAIPAGVIADLHNRKSIIIYAQLLMSLLAFLMAAVTFMGGMTDILLLAMTFLLNVGYAFNQPAWQALSSTLVPASEIKQSAALNNLSFNLSRCIGPALAGLYFATLGPAFLFILNGISFLGVIVVFQAKVNLVDHVKSKFEFKKVIKGFQEGMLFFTEYPILKGIVSKSFMYFFLAAFLWSILPYFVIVYRHMSNNDLGILTSAAGIGAVLNAYYIYYLRRFLSDNQLTTLAILLASVSMFLFAIINIYSIYFIAMLVFGFSWALSVSVFNGLLQAEFPKHIRSRLIGMYYVFFAAAQAFGSYISGKSIQIFGMEHTLICAASLMLLFGYMYLVPSAGVNVFRIFYKERNN